MFSSQMSEKMVNSRPGNVQPIFKTGEYAFMIKKILTLTACTICLASCSRELSPDHYTARQAGQTSITRPGIIKQVTSVKITGSDSLEENGLGIVGGGVAGGVIGSAAGRGNLLPTALGAVAGAVTGSLIEKKLKEQNGWEYIVEFEDGTFISLVQGENTPMNEGQPVYVISNQWGRSRIVPRN